MNFFGHFHAHNQANTYRPLRESLCRGSGELLSIPQAPSRVALKKCMDICRDQGYDAAIDSGCLSPALAIEKDVYRRDGILDWERDVLKPSSYTPADCASDCWENTYCVYWQYGPAYDEDTRAIDEHHVYCGHSYISDFHNIKNVGYLNQSYGECEQQQCDGQWTSFFANLDERWKKTDDAHFRSLSRISSYINLKFLNCDIIEGAPTSTEQPSQSMRKRYLDDIMIIAHCSCTMLMYGESNDYAKSLACLETCEKVGLPEAVAMGCVYGQSLLDKGAVETNGFIEEEADTLRGKTDSISVPECALRCLKDPDCYYWQYGRTLRLPNLPDTTHIICLLLSYEEYMSYMRKTELAPYTFYKNMSRLTCQSHETNYILDIDRAALAHEDHYSYEQSARVSGFRYWDVPFDRCNPPEHPTKPPTEPPTKPPTEPPTKPPTEPPTKPPTEPPTKPPTETPTKPPTEPPTKPPTEPPTKPPTEPPTKPPTEPPTEPPTSTTVEPTGSLSTKTPNPTGSTGSPNPTVVPPPASSTSGSSKPATSTSPPLSTTSYGSETDGTYSTDGADNTTADGSTQEEQPGQSKTGIIVGSAAAGAAVLAGVGYEVWNLATRPASANFNNEACFTRCSGVQSAGALTDRENLMSLDEDAFFVVAS